MSIKQQFGDSEKGHLQDKRSDNENTGSDASDSEDEVWFEASLGEELTEEAIINSADGNSSSEATSINNNGNTEVSNAEVINEYSERCHIHEDNAIKYFCKSCDKIGCHECVVIEHRHCPKPAYIVNLAEHLFDSEEYLHFRQDLTSMATTLEIHKNRYEFNNQTRENLRANALLAIKQQRDEINNLFDHLEVKVRSTVEERDNTGKSNLNEVSQQHYTLATDLQIMSSDIEYKHARGQKFQLFIAMKKAAEQLPYMKSHIANLEARNKITRYAFLPSAELMTMYNLEGLGTIKLQKSDLKRTLKFQRDIKIDAEQDKVPCIITGICVLSKNSLVVADHANGNLKLIDIPNVKVLSLLDMSSHPWEITKIEDRQIAVTVPYRGVVKFLSVMPSNDLYEEHEIKVYGECYGIVYIKESSDILVVSFKKLFPAVEILDMTGQVLQTFSWRYLFQWPGRLALSPDHNLVYVSDFETNRVVSITFEGKINAFFEDSGMKKPTAVTVDNNGSVYVLSRHGEIYQLSENCSEVHRVQALPYGSESIAYCSKENKLYFGMTKKNVISVFEMK